MAADPADLAILEADRKTHPPGPDHTLYTSPPPSGPLSEIEQKLQIITNTRIHTKPTKQLRDMIDSGEFRSAKELTDYVLVNSGRNGGRPGM